MENNEILENFKIYINKNYQSFKKKYKQFCFQNNYIFDIDVYHQAILNCLEHIQKSGLKDISEKGMDNYFFITFKNLTFKNFNNLTKNQKIIDSINDNNDVYDKQYVSFDDLQNSVINERVNKIIKYVKDNYHQIYYKIWFYKHFLTIDGKPLRYRDLVKITKISNCKKIVCQINKDIKEKYKDIWKY